MRHLEVFKNVRLMQYIATVSATLSLTCSGMYTCWSSPNIPRLTSPDSPIGVTLLPSEASWVASSFQLGYIPGGIISGLIVSRLGPKISLLIASIPLCCPWIAIMFAKSGLTLCIARFFAGIGSSIALTAVPIYNGEVAAKDIRGKLGSTSSLLTIVGNLVVLSFGPFVSYVTLAIICCCFPLMFAAIFWFMPESPYYLVKMDNTDAARDTIRKLTGKKADKKVVQDQLDEVTAIIEHDMKNKSTFWELVSKSMYRKALLIMIGLKLIQQFSGMAAIDAYMQTIIKASSSSISPEFSSIIFGAIQLLSVLIAASFVDRVGRRPLLIASALGCAFASSIEGVYFFLQHDPDYSYIVDNLSWLPTTGIVLFLIMDAVGLATLPFVLMGEIFPANIKSHAVALNTVLNGSLGCLVVLCFDPISRLWGMFATFCLFAGVATSGAIFIFFVLPETKNKSFAEIQASLRKTSTTNPV